MIGNFQTSKSLNVREKEYRCLGSYYVLTTYIVYCMNLKKLERYLRVNLLGPGPSSYKKKKNLQGRGVTKFEKHRIRMTLVCIVTISFGVYLVLWLF
jgi:hypothetical protein